jgi:hypothetical protein
MFVQGRWGCIKSHLNLISTIVYALVKSITVVHLNTGLDEVTLGVTTAAKHILNDCGLVYLCLGGNFQFWNP